MKSDVLGFFLHNSNLLPNTKCVLCIYDIHFLNNMLDSREIISVFCFQIDQLCLVLLGEGCFFPITLIYTSLFSVALLA